MKKHWWHPKTEFKKGHLSYWTEKSKEKNSLSHLGLNKGKHLSEETKKKLSISHKKLTNHPGRFKKGHIPTTEMRKKISESRKGKTHSPTWYPKKELNPNWQGGITPERERIRKSKEYEIWRKAVFERDKYTCVWCGQIGGKLHADHIKSFADYPELRFAIDNGRTLCINCHAKTTNYLVYKGKKFNKQSITKT